MLLLLSQLLLPLALPPSVVAAQSSQANLTPLAVIQGSGVASPLNEQVVTTWGVVTGVTSDGFYLQDPVSDGDPLTSDGIFAFTYDAPTVTVGECIEVMGEITEYYAKSELNWIEAITPSTQCGAQVVIPATLPPLRPGDDPISLLEPFEGMLVRLDHMQGVVHGPTKRFVDGEEELAFLPSHWQRYLGPVHLFHDQAALTGLIYLSNSLGATLPTLQWSELIQVEDGGLVGVLDYNFGKYQLLPLSDQVITAIAHEATDKVSDIASLTPITTRDDEYGICSFNLHGFGQGTAQFPNPADYEAALHQRAQVIANELAGCTVIALQETGSPADATALAQRLTEVFALDYTAISLAGPTSFEPEFPLTNSILVDSARVAVELSESIIGCASEDFGIAAPGACPVGEYPLFDRPPLLARLLISGPPDAPWPNAVQLWVIDNHWKSKSGDETANARLRAAQAQTVAERVQAILALDPAAQIVVLGDLNDYYQGAAVSTLQIATGLFHPYEWLPPLDRYTYIFNGAAQVLDHALVTPNLAPQLAQVEIRHIHADQPTGDTSLAHSDHDPLLLRLRPNGAALVAGTLGWGGINVTATDESGALLAQTSTDANGDFRLWGLPIGSVTLQMSAPAWIALDEPAQVVQTAAGLLTLEKAPARHISAITGAWIALQTPWLAQSQIVIP